MTDFSFTSGELMLVYVAVEALRDQMEEVLDDRGSYSQEQINNAIDNKAVCNSVLRKIKSVLNSAGLENPPRES